jgi:hypothetical protein
LLTWDQWHMPPNTAYWLRQGLTNALPGLARTTILSVSASQEARISIKSHHISHSLISWLKYSTLFSMWKALTSNSSTTKKLKIT